MKYKHTVKWGTVFFIAFVLLSLGVGVVIVLGVALGGLQPVGYYSMTPSWLQVTFYPIIGVVLIGLGGLVWGYGSILLFYSTFALLIEEQTSRQFDTEAVKSDILAVLDDRLADIHQETTQTRRLVDRISRDEAASDFDFNDDLAD